MQGWPFIPNPLIWSGTCKAVRVDVPAINCVHQIQQQRLYVAFSAQKRMYVLHDHLLGLYDYFEYILGQDLGFRWCRTGVLVPELCGFAGHI